MAYTQLTTSAASIAFVRELGGTGLHVGIFGALPTGMLFLQFLAAVVANKLTYRRRLWFWLTLLQRLIVLPVAAGPWLFPQVPDTVWVWTFLIGTAANQGLIHFTTPLWLSWMGDYLPHVGLNRYWGIRHLWMQWTAAASMLLSVWVLMGTDLSIRTALPLLVGIGAVLGVIDICLFARVDEPPVTPHPSPSVWELLKGPFRSREFRSFIRFTSFWHFAAMLGAPFISLYLLEIIGLSIGQVMLLWTFSWVGGAVFSRKLGHWAETYGNRAVLIACIWLKPLNMITLLLIPTDHTTVMAILIPVFMVDALLNAGVAIANNGFMLKNSPAANRTMYIAAGTAIAGLIGGFTAVVAGGGLAYLQTRTTDPATPYYILFAASLAMRLIASVRVLRVREPATETPLPTLTSLIGATPSRILRFPVGLYQSWSSDEEDELKDAAKRRNRKRNGADAVLTVD
ncbi:MAG: MFS transporter [Planctomycetaceae bacterium]|nr:MFS transporter [Planctomycetaceae bacterium]MCA9111449.1 MFS transporter [Planctomycetaceae bacterium]